MPIDDKKQQIDDSKKNQNDSGIVGENKRIIKESYSPKVELDTTKPPQGDQGTTEKK